MEESQTLKENDESIDEIVPPNPSGTGGEKTPLNPLTGTLLKPEEEEDFRQFQEIKKTTGLTKFSESAKEAQRLAKINKEQLEALTEKELKEVNPDWDDMSDQEKADAKRNLQNDKDIKILKAKEKWRDDYRGLPSEIKKLIEEKGGEEAFKDFACDPMRATADILTVAKAYVLDAVKTTVKPPESKPGLEVRGGGKPPQPTKEGYTVEEAANLRKNKPALYAKLVQSGRMKIVNE